MDELGFIEGLIGAAETGGLGVIWYFWKRIQKKREMLSELDKLVQAKNDEIQDLKQLIHVKDLEIKLLSK